MSTRWEPDAARTELDCEECGDAMCAAGEKLCPPCQRDKEWSAEIEAARERAKHTAKHTERSKA